MNMPEPPALPVLTDRSADILNRIRSAFAEKGFDGASMQDLARAAGMSVGNFYRYFPSKDAIIAAMAAYDMAEMEADFAAVQVSDDPLALIREKIRYKISDACSDHGRLWSEITAAAQRRPEVAQISCGVEDVVAFNLVQVFARLAGVSPEAAQDRICVQVRFIILLVKAAAMRHASQPDPQVEELVLKTIDNVINDIISAARE
ncbi:TetR/AcrR family transcriptional regulator [Rhodobacter sp.]